MKLLILIISLSISTLVNASNGSAEQLIIGGLEAYKNNGARAAIQAWIKGSGIEGSKDALSQANSLRQIEDFYGQYEGYEIVRTHKISDRSIMVLFVMNYSKGITYAKIQTYKTKSNNWITTEFKFHTDASIIWPKSDAFGQ